MANSWPPDQVFGPPYIPSNLPSNKEQQKKALEEFMRAVQERTPKPGFIKHSDHKPRFHLISPKFLLGLAKILTFGAVKYDERNYLKCETPFATYFSALQRHLCAWAGGEAKDPESGESHLYHAACCLQFLAEFEEAGNLKDYPGGVAQGSAPGT